MTASAWVDDCKLPCLSHQSIREASAENCAISCVVHTPIRVTTQDQVSRVFVFPEGKGDAGRHRRCTQCAECT